MNLYAIRRPEAWQTLQEVEAVGAKSSRIGADMADKVRWIRSYVITEPDGKFGTICIYEGRDVQAVQEHARRVGMPGELVYPVVDTILVNADPKPAAKAA
jgi:hypothetical protein